MLTITPHEQAYVQYVQSWLALKARIYAITYS